MTRTRYLEPKSVVLGRSGRGMGKRPRVAVISRVFFRQGAGGGLFARAAQKAPCFYRIPLTPTSCGGFEGFDQKPRFLGKTAARLTAFLAVRRLFSEPDNMG